MNVFYQHFIKLLVEFLKRKNDPSYSTTDSPKENGKEDAKTDGLEAPKEEAEKTTDQQGEKQGTKVVAGGRADLSAGFVQNNVCELLSYCIRHHGYRIKYFLLGGNAVQKVMKLLDHKDAFLVLGIHPSPSSPPLSPPLSPSAILF